MDNLDFNIPLHLREALERYRDWHLPPGNFLRAVLENNLAETVGLADPRSFAHLREILEWLWHKMPATAWGSFERVEEWLAVRTQTSNAPPLAGE